MPAQKRKATSKGTGVPDKKARVSTQDPESTLTTRPKRKSVGTPQYNLTRLRRKTDRGAIAQEVADSGLARDPPRPRGRPRKQTTSATIPSNTATATAGRPRGRPRLNKIQAKSSTIKSTSRTMEDAAVKRPRGRPSKAAGSKAATRPATSKAKSTAKKKSTQTEALGEITASPGRRGRPRRKTSGPTTEDTPTVSLEPETMSGTDKPDDEAMEEEQGDRQYWLMKAEPNDRFENGVNVKFSIDDLAAAEAPEPWDGVRNYGARNNMRAMRKGDLAFFYHSNCKVPGIVGIMRIVQEHTPDKSAFDPKHPYYDPKSVPSDPKWDCVHVQFVKKFSEQITLKMLQENRNSSGELANMQLLKMGRLSVSAVSPKEWGYILSIVKVDVHVGEDDDIVNEVDGYESDTDGETLPETAKGAVDGKMLDEVKSAQAEDELAEAAGQ